jgi:hypothetical protein
VGLLHGDTTGRSETAWRELSSDCFPVDKELARRMGRRAMEWVNERYDAIKQVSGLENMFQRLIQETRQTPNEYPVQEFNGSLCE